MKHSRRFFTITAVLGVCLSGMAVCSLHSATEVADTERPSADARQPIDPTGEGPRIPRAPATPIAGAATAESAELAELRQEVARLRRQMPAQRERQAAAQPAGPNGQAPAAEARRMHRDTRAEREAKVREYMAGVDTAFRKEATDPQWSSATSSVIHAALVADNDLRPLAGGVECRSRTCRVEITDDGSGKLGKLLPMFAQQVGQELPSVVADRVETARGVATMVLYMSRGDETPAIVR
jgi:hypothetical protein